MLTAVPALPGHYVDTNTPCSDALLRLVKASGALGVTRYVGLPNNNPANDISGAELLRIAAAGLACCLVQHVRGPEKGFTGWRPSRHSGADDAAAAVAAAQAAGYPAGAHLFLDLENIDDGAFATIQYAVAWQHVVIAAGYRAGLYVGFQVPLHPLDLYDLPGFDCYWSDAGHREVATRGCAVIQGAGIVVGGVPFVCAESMAAAA